MPTSAELQLELDDVKTAIKAVLTGAQKYTFDSGQSKQMVEKGNLKELQRLKNSLESELSLKIKEECGTQRGKGVFHSPDDFGTQNPAP